MTKEALINQRFPNPSRLKAWPNAGRNALAEKNMIVFGILLHIFAQANSNPKGIIALMDGLCSPTKSQSDE